MSTKMTSIAHPETKSMKEKSEEIRNAGLSDEAQTGKPVRREGHPDEIKAAQVPPEAQPDELPETKTFIPEPSASEPRKKTPEEMKNHPDEYYSDEVDQDVVDEMGWEAPQQSNASRFSRLKKSKVYERGDYELWVSESPEMVKYGHKPFSWGIKKKKATQWADVSAYVYNNFNEAESDGKNAIAAHINRG